MGSAPSVRPGFSPLDERFQVPSEQVLPKVLEWGVRLALGRSFEQAATEMAIQHQVAIGGETLRRYAETLGAIQEQREQDEVDHLLKTAPLPPVAPPRLVASVDGGMVRLCGGTWAEIKLVAIGTPEAHGEEMRTTHLSYCARLADAETFADASLGELHRRGVETAGEVEAVTDGAEWLQGYFDLHRPNAVRVLDFFHAAERLQKIGVLVFDEHPATAQRWTARKRHQLRHRGPDVLLDQLRRWQRRFPALHEHVEYLAKRREQMRYPQFAAQGWVLGSGAVESGHKQVWQARLKGPGMSWERRHVNPLLVLCSLDRNGRWAEQWPLLWRERERCRRDQHRLLAQERRLARHPTPPPVPSPTVPSPKPPARPPAPHPWRRYHRQLAS